MKIIDLSKLKERRDIITSSPKIDYAILAQSMAVVLGIVTIFISILALFSIACYYVISYIMR